MKIIDLKGGYDAIFGLGDLCLTAVQLEKNDLRPFAGPLDWVGSPNLSDVNHLLRNRFSGFMEQANLTIGGYASENYLWVKDSAYNMNTGHDFDTDRNTLYKLTTYSEVKEKYDRRVKRFLEKTATCERVLFVRTEGSFEEAQELQSILEDIVKNDFRVLLVNHGNVQGIVDKEWALEKVCGVEFPDVDKWEGNDHHWSTIFDGIYLK